MNLSRKLLLPALLLSSLLLSCANPTPPTPPTLPTAIEKPHPRYPSFFGVEASGKSIVFILDHSGSMIDNWDFLRQEAINTVSRLPETTQFNVLMVSEKTTPIYDVLQTATAQAKKNLAAKLNNLRAQGSNDDLLGPFQDAFQQAFAMKPDAICFVTDGHLDPRLTSVIQTLNAEKNTHLHTFAFINPEPSYKEQLKDIAKNNGGTYKFVTEKDLGK